MNLLEPISSLKGVGKKRLEAFEHYGIRTIRDLLQIVPKRYEDRTQIGSLKNESDIAFTIKVKINRRGTVRYHRYQQSFFIVEIMDDQGNLGDAIFFNQPFLKYAFQEGQEYYFYCTVNHKKTKPRVYNPKYAPIDKDFLIITPKYRKFEGIPKALLPKLFKQVIDELEIEDFLPEKYREKYDLISLDKMYQCIHFPESKEDLLKAQRRLKFNEALKINTGIYSSNLIEETTDIVLTNFDLIEDFVKDLPFKLTNAQKRVVKEILKDVSSGKPMNRMIEGDVGSGKTIVAILITYLFALNGLQTAYMAPTEILARQHSKTFKNMLGKFGIKVELLTGHITSRERYSIRERLKRGDIDVVVGTHSLIQESTEFYNLGLIITDEQHRFGVRQRGKLLSKGNPHTLVMSATPIPRTLALSYYGDLDLSILDELPEGRKRIKTYFYKFKQFKKILDFILKEIEKGYQAFVVCPYINDSEDDTEVISVNTAFKEINNYLGDQINVGFLHGQLEQEEKEKTVSDFENKKIDLLVATSIIEVGIDIPNVSVIAILNADRYGLAQLHQLRGRTGRSSIQSYCFLVSNNVNEESLERMKTMVETNDGHKIAMVDLKMRGHGDYFGTDQSGFGNIKYLSPFHDRDILENSLEIVKDVFNSKKAEDILCRDYLNKSFAYEVSHIAMN